MTLTAPAWFVTPELVAKADAVDERTLARVRFMREHGYAVLAGVALVLAVGIWVVATYRHPFEALVLGVLAAPFLVNYAERIDMAPQRQERAETAMRLRRELVEHGEAKFTAIPDLIHGWVDLTAAYESLPVGQRPRALSRTHAKYWQYLCDVQARPGYYRYGQSGDSSILMARARDYRAAALSAQMSDGAVAAEKQALSLAV